MLRNLLQMAESSPSSIQPNPNPSLSSTQAAPKQHPSSTRKEQQLQTSILAIDAVEARGGGGGRRRRSREVMVVVVVQVVCFLDFMVQLIYVQSSPLSPPHYFSNSFISCLSLSLSLPFIQTKPPHSNPEKHQKQALHSSKKNILISSYFVIVARALFLGRALAALTIATLHELPPNSRPHSLSHTPSLKSHHDHQARNHPNI